MASVLYAEIYLICLIIAGILLGWMVKNGMQSSAERWLARILTCFIINFISNFLFTVFHSIVITPYITPLSYLFKTLYHISLSVGVFLWCVYAEIELRSGQLQNGQKLKRWLIPAVVPVLFALTNLWNHQLFRFEDGIYIRGVLFQVQMCYLLIFSGYETVRLIRRAWVESDPGHRTHLVITGTFSLCVLAAWVLSFIGEAFPVICVAIIVELLFLFLGTTITQISLDKLTQVNNRQNLMGFMNYKLRNCTGELYLLMIDVDCFKTINDTYGHLEGDNALVVVSSGLKRACGPYQPRPYISRYGGDEFIVVMEADRAAVDRLVDEIRENIAALNHSARYDLQISVGIARYERGQTPKELIDAADKMLYQVKHARKTAR
ncbi:MAG: GGDEF domain-containing protein [Oscillospiraceae bacterium]|nr:GGDEF domain-containing protein [Oscillospiraceae bacterium]